MTDDAAERAMRAAAGKEWTRLKLGPHWDRESFVRGWLAAKAHARATREAGWRPIESAPRDGTQILSALRGDMIPVWWFQATFWTKQGRWDGFPGEVTPTHWRDLPPPPEAGK